MNAENHEKPSRSARAWSLLTGILAVETLGAAVLLAISVYGAIVARDQPFGEVLSLLASSVIAFVFTVVCIVGVLSRRGWARAASMTLQILTLAVATAMLQGILGSAWLGWALIIVTVLGIIGVIVSRAADQTAGGSGAAQPDARD